MYKPLIQFQIDHLDTISWVLVLGFFGISSVMFDGAVVPSLLGAGAIVLLMLVISHSVDLILGVMRNHPRIGEFTGYITNGPEALCVLVGLLNNKLLFAAGVPLGSNFANPILMLISAGMLGALAIVFSAGKKALLLLAITAILAGLFYLPVVQASPVTLSLWAGLGLVISVLCYRNMGSETADEEDDIAFHPVLLLPAGAMLLSAGYFLDPAVSMTAQNSHVPEGAISFFVLSFISSWPEFRSVTSLFKMKRYASGAINIIVSNITNLWLAIVAVIVYLASMWMA